MNKGSDLEKKISSNYEDTNELRWEIISQSERVGNLERKFKVMEDSWEDKMDQLGIF